MRAFPTLANLERFHEAVGGIAQRRFFLLVALLIGYQLLVNGLGTIPREPYRLTALDPFNQVTAYPENYFQRSPLLPLIGRFSNLTSPLEFAGLSLVLVIIGWVIFGVLMRRKRGNEVALLFFALMLSHPVSLILISWLGTPDGISFLLTTLLLFVRSVPATATIGALGAFNHPVMNIIAPVLLTLRWAAGEMKGGRRRLIWGLVGLLIGNLAVLGYLNYFEIETMSRMDFLFSRSLATWIRQNLSLFPYTLYSLHQSVWFALALCLPILYRLDVRYLRLFLVTQLLLFAIVFFTVDTTRIFSLLAWAPAIHCVQHTLRVAEAEEGGVLPRLRGALVAMAAIGLLIPGFYMWGGELHTSNFNSFYLSIRRLLEGLGA